MLQCNINRPAFAAAEIFPTRRSRGCAMRAAGSWRNGAGSRVPRGSGHMVWIWRWARF